MKCILVLEEGLEPEEKPDFNGNYFLYHLLGAENVIVVPNGADLMEEMHKVAKEVSEKGNTPYVIPVGGSNPTGAMGYVACAQEIMAQSFDQGIDFSSVVCVSGSGGMHAGLITGFAGTQSNIPVIGINVSRGKAEQEEKVAKLVDETSAHVGIPNFIPREAVTCFDEYVGPGYALPTPEMVEAVQLLAKTEGILLDPVYTGKAVAGLIDLIRKGTFKKKTTFYSYIQVVHQLYMRIRLYCVSMKKHWVSNAFVIYWNYYSVGGEYMSSNLKWIIYTVLSISILFILFVAYGVYLYFT